MLNNEMLVAEAEQKMIKKLKYNYIVIEGNIGTGKTSLATRISQDFDTRLVLERFAENPFLPLFYKHQSRYAFALELSFLADRYQQLNDELAPQELFKQQTFHCLTSDWEFNTLTFNVSVNESSKSLLLRFKMGCNMSGNISERGAKVNLLS